MGRHERMDLEIELNVFRNSAENIAVQMMAAGRPGHALRFRKAASYAAGLAAFIRTQEVIPPDPVSRDSFNEMHNNVRRLKP